MRLPHHGARQNEAARNGEKLMSPVRQRRVFGRREEAQRDIPDGGAGAQARDTRRDRFRPRHRRAASRGQRRQRAASPDRAIIVITHYQRLLDYIVPDFVHVLAEGRIVKSGGKSWRTSSRTRATRRFGVYDARRGGSAMTCRRPKEHASWVETIKARRTRSRPGCRPIVRLRLSASLTWVSRHKR